MLTWRITHLVSVVSCSFIKKNKMPKHKLRFRELLSEQLYFLESSISSYSDVEFEAKRVASSIRTLIHDTKNSFSLLNLLGFKDSLNFINSASPNDGKLHSMTGMSNVRGTSLNQYFGLLAKVNKDNRLIVVPLFQQHLPEWHKRYSKSNFSNWWEMEIINVDGIGVTRKELILNVTNKDGGAHVDPNLPTNYHQIKTTKLILNIKGNETEFERNIVYASVIQIGWELLRSIKEENC